MYKIYTIPHHISYPNFLRDSSRREEDILLERYFNDIYSVYLNKLTSYVLQVKEDAEAASELRAMFEEIIKVRGILNKDREYDKI